MRRKKEGLLPSDLEATVYDWGPGGVPRGQPLDYGDLHTITTHADLIQQRINSLDVVDVALLADLLEQQSEAGEYTDLAAKLRRIAELATGNH